VGRALHLALAFFLALNAASAARRVLYVTTSAGYRHDSIEASVEVMREIVSQSGVLEIVHTEDVTQINAANLRGFDAVYFFTSGELPLSPQQKTDLLDFVRQGKGFGGSHSATDTLYTWPEYGEMIGGIFDGHPWAQEASFDVEDPASPLVRHMAPGFRATEEVYQFRNFSRDRVRVLVSLDTRSVNLGASGVNRTDGDFPLVWIRRYGAGRVFYSAFGHFVESFRLPIFRTMLLQSLLWLTGEIEADATPRPIAPVAAVSSDSYAPGSLIAIGGERLTGSPSSAAGLPLPMSLGGTRVEVNGKAVPLFSVAPDTVLAQLPYVLDPGQPASLVVFNRDRPSPAVPLRIAPAAPVLWAAVRFGGYALVYATGLGSTTPAVVEGSAAPVVPLARTLSRPVLRIGGQTAQVDFSGLVPGYAGLYQVNAFIPAQGEKLEIVLEAGGLVSNTIVLQ
jgi:type 1 glutamine amidotransferase